MSGTQDNAALTLKATRWLGEHQGSVRKRHYPAFHLAAPSGWINDPNGFCFALGQYHLFYQHYPYDAQWGPMHWGHAVSDDLIHWHHCPVALAPSEAYDKDGCFSGSAIEHDGKLYLIYTGHVWLKEPGNDDAIREVQCLAVSKDGLHFEKQGVIIEPPEGVMHFRDPKVWEENGKFYLVLGARMPGDRAQILKYASEDLRTWTLMGPVLSAPEGEAFMYECPDVFPLDGKYVAALSPMGLKPQGIERNNPSINSYVVAAAGEGFDPSQLKEIDHGHDFYASQSMLAPDGRRIMVAWLSMWKLPFASYKDNWCGMLTLPRELSLKDGKLIQKPVREVQSLYKKEKSLGSIEVTNGVSTLCETFKRCRLTLKVTAGASAECYGLRLGNALSLYVDRQHGELTLLRMEEGFFAPRSMQLESVRDLDLEIFIDKSAIEVFVNGGEATFTTAFYCEERSTLTLFATNGTAAFKEVTLTALNNVMKGERIGRDSQ